MLKHHRKPQPKANRQTKTHAKKRAARPTAHPMRAQRRALTTTSMTTPLSRRRVATINTMSHKTAPTTSPQQQSARQFFGSAFPHAAHPHAQYNGTHLTGGMSPYPMSGDFDPTGKPIQRATTILCVRKGDKVVMIGDGQVSLGPTIVKPNAKKIRRIGNGTVITGFAGSTADAFALLGLLEQHLEQHPGQLLRAAVETAKGWRTDKYTRHLEAMLIASDENISLCISGNGDVIESHDGLLGIGSGSMYALSAARALIDMPEVDAMTIAKKSMNIAADICVYTNHNFIIDTIDVKPATSAQIGSLDTALSTPIGTKPDEPVVYNEAKDVKM